MAVTVRDLQGLLWVMVTLLQLELELQRWEEGGGISVSRQSNSNYSFNCCVSMSLYCVPQHLCIAQFNFCFEKPDHCKYNVVSASSDGSFFLSQR